MPKPPKPSTLLKRALKLFGPTGKHWFQGDFQVEPGDEDYKPKYGKGAFCAIGSLMRINTEREGEAEHYLYRAVRRISRNVSIASYNDRKGRTFPQIRKLFNTAIALAQEEGN